MGESPRPHKRAKHMFVESNRGIIVRHLLAGVLFGLLFPIAANVLVIVQDGLDLSVAGIGAAHARNSLLYIIDSAPFFLGLFAAVAGIHRARFAEAQRLREQQVLTDELTRINNRQFGQLKLAEMIPLARRRKRRIGMVFIDIDRFKRLNDNLGHRFGDQVLIALARRLKESIFPDEYVARLGGDEFMVIVPNLRDLADIHTLARRFAGVCHGELLIDGKTHRVSTSIGAAVFPDHGDDMEALFRHAGVALNENRNTKKRAYEVFDPVLLQAVREEYTLEKELEGAIERNEFSLCYQAIVESQTQAIVGAEALLRWRNRHLGAVPPDKFIPIAEKSGVILAIGDWVLDEACRQNQAWQAAGLPAISIAVNVSPMQLVHQHFAENVVQALEDSGMNPACLKLEVTETASMQNVVEVREIFGGLRQRGIRLSIDDSGTGYSSLSKLKSLSVDDLKIDKSFIADIKIDAGAGNFAIVEAIVAMARTLNIQVVAEGVETPLQLDVLRRLECDYSQGYLFSKPLPPDEFAQLLARGVLPVDVADSA